MFADYLAPSSRSQETLLTSYLIIGYCCILWWIHDLHGLFEFSILWFLVEDFSRSGKVRYWVSLFILSIQFILFILSIQFIIKGDLFEWVVFVILELIDFDEPPLGKYHAGKSFDSSFLVEIHWPISFDFFFNCSLPLEVCCWLKFNWLWIYDS